VHEKDQEATVREMEKLYHPPHRSYIEQRVMTATGWRWVAWSARAVLDEDGQVTAIVAVGRDITEQKEAEQKLRSRENLLSSIFRAAPTGIGMVSNRVLLTVNERVCQMTGYAKEELVGQSSRILYPSDKDFDFVGREKYRQIGDMGTGTVETRWQRKDGRIIDLLLSSTPINPRDLSAGVTFTALDITKRKQAEKDSEQLQKQLLQANKLESVGRLAGGVAHDFNNMLGVILGHCDLAMMQLPASEPLHANLTEIRKAAQRSADLTRQLLAFARKQAVMPLVLDLNDTVTSMLKMLERLIGEQIVLAWIPGEDLWSVKIDPAQVDQVLANLAVNARDAIDGPGKVTIETRNTTIDKALVTSHEGFVRGDYVMLALSDNGCGMDKQTLEHLFEPFYTTKEIGQGTGLGLATIYGIIKQNKGVIDVATQPGKGTTFRVYLPRYAEETNDAEIDIPREDGPISLGNGETVLIVEDEKEMLDIGKVMLERLGYRVLTAATPGEALQVTESHGKEIDLVITDIVMPEMNGPELKKQLNEKIPGMKYLFMSGYPSDVVALHGIPDPERSFIQKPFQIRDLAFKIKATLQSSTIQ
ncbi:MAG: PAS domain S-box protein, partial [Desulfosarcinaceae bacterium]